MYGVAKQENAQIKCIVDANPPEVDFKWTFNNSAESIDVAASHVSRHGKHENFSIFLRETLQLRVKWKILTQFVASQYEGERSARHR